MTTRAGRQTAALIALLKTLPVDQLVEVLDGVAAAPRDPVPSEQRDQRNRRCGICHEVYPRCRLLWAADHDFEPPTRPRTLHQVGDDS